MDRADGHDAVTDARAEFVLLSSDDCHLCEHAQGVLGRLERELGLAWHEVDAQSPEGERLAATAPPLRPVLFGPDGEAIAYGRLSEKRLRRDLIAAQPGLGSEGAANG